MDVLKLPKTRAQIQKEYRERKKKNDPEYLVKERERATKNRILIGAVALETQQNRRARDREYARKYRGRKKAKDKLIIQMNFRKDRSDKKMRVRKRSKALEQARAVIRDLHKKNKKLSTKYETLARKVRRSGDSTCEKQHDAEIIPDHSQTPRSKAHRFLRRMNISPKKPLVRKLIMADIVTREALTVKSTVQRIASGKITKKYRMLRHAHAQYGIPRKAPRRKAQKNIKADQIRKAVCDFLEREDNSRCLPGKADVITEERSGTRVAKRVLTDYLANLHMKFSAENPHVMISFTTFTRCRPKHVQLAKFIARNTCLCTQHTNMAMTLKALKTAGVNITANPEEAVRSISEERMIELLNSLDEEETYQYQEWKRVEMADGKKRMKVVQNVAKGDAMKKTTMTQYKKFMNHCQRIKTQYKALKDLKGNMPENEVLIQMDFAENFTAHSADEPQSAYWNQTGVSLHPVVVYWKTEQELHHRSFVFVSEELSHNASAVYCIMKLLKNEIRNILPNVSTFHYWTDGPTSQYRNKTIFSLVENHSRIFGVKATWDYFESGHGKSACDGIGAVAKSAAADAIKQQKAQIQDANDFFKWASSKQSAIKYILYTKDDFAEAEQQVRSFSGRLKPVSGTFGIHAIRECQEGGLYVSRDSCFDCCLFMVNHHCNWENVQVTQDVELQQVQQLPQQPLHAQQPQIAETEQIPHQEENVTFDVGDWVRALYDGEWYLGLIEDVDDQECLITFMKTCRNSSKVSFQWPSVPDRIWVSVVNVRVVEAPQPMGRSKRFFEHKEWL